MTPVAIKKAVKDAVKEAIDERRIEPLFTRASDVACIRILQRLRIALDRAGHGVERRVLRGRAGARHRAGSVPGTAAQIRHVLVDIHRVTREASRLARHEFGESVQRGSRKGRAGYRNIVSGLRCGR